ncbi:HetZ-related protein 2 [Spirulina subsalsa FACHB-351]|uniref:HetZ-related protein 2 n=1 Tax=Spirulina subsalsa FACHB-351 TaxID=234711 RepID=A0ABT3L649_9CYAN|nr:HetZ-related protein 2 [Spirulina subsalsa FACHB-351]
MQTVQQGLKERKSMNGLVEELQQTWDQCLRVDCPDLSEARRNSIVRWLLGEDLTRWEGLDARQERIAKQAMEYRYRILKQRYLGVPPSRAYGNLINRLGSLVVLRNKIRTWVALSRDRKRAVADVLQEVIQEMLNSDRYIQSAIAWIGECTEDKVLRNTLLLTSVEEYCMRPIRNQPLLVYRFVNYLRRSQRGGMTQIPQTERIKMISEEIAVDETDSPVSLLDAEAVTSYQEQQDWEEQQLLRQTVQDEFEQYLLEKVEPLAVSWLRLYLQGCSQDAIAQQLNLPVKQVYRLREKVSYHAVKIFALKSRPELVANWLQISLKEHNLGLTLSQWEQFWQGLTPLQQDILGQLKENRGIDAIAKTLKLKKSQVMSEWTKAYQIAQGLRGE